MIETSLEGSMVNITAQHIDIGVTDTPRLRDRFKMRLALRRALRSACFERFLTRLIILYAVSLCVLSYLEALPGNNGFNVRALQALDFSIFAVFCAEIGLKLYAFRRSFFRNGWNVFDFLVVTVSIIGMASSITAFRALRVLRTLRLVKRVPSMRIAPC